jgi:hypothetical protein
MKASPTAKHDTKWVFFKKGTCSQTMFYILNREFGNPMEAEEAAADPLAGGILRQGYQCGFIWGATMAAGAEAHKRCNGCQQTTGLAMKASRDLAASFEERAKSLECHDITNTNWLQKGSVLKYMAKGKMVTCFRLADKWAPEAIQTAKTALDAESSEIPQHAVSCASEVVKKMGGNKKEQAIVAGLAGGIGLSGNGCGALAAAIWKSSLEWVKENPGKSGYNNPNANKVLEAFFSASDYEFECKKITGRQFKTIEEHSDFIKNGGCKQLLDALAVSKA